MTRADTMRAIAVREGKGPAEALHVVTVTTPRPGPGQILIRVRAAGVNRPDIAQREGNYPPPPGASEIIGLEVAGDVVDMGPDTPRWTIGDKVTALLPGGGYAEYAVVDARHALPIPDGMGYSEAAALPETLFTVWANLFERGRLQAGETVVIHGANSGIGTTAILMAKAAGARVVATARNAEKAAWARQLGADRPVDNSAEDFVAVVTELGGADVILDIGGGSWFDRNIAALKPDGRLAQIAFLDGAEVTLNLGLLLFKRLTITGSTLRARPAEEKARITREIETHVWPWVKDGKVRPPVDREFALSEAAAAHRHLETGSQFGKVTLIP